MPSKKVLKRWDATGPRSDGGAEESQVFSLTASAEEKQPKFD